jgi:predicted  nucleic acid-binding Zn-ribbon protein
MEQYNGLKKRLENYSRQIDNFEKSVKAALENKHAWRRKYMAKEGELEAVKVCVPYPLLFHIQKKDTR